MNSPRPIIATLIVDKEAQQRFQRLRNRYYPASRVPAHITLFRNLPGKIPNDITTRISALCDEIAPFDIRAEAPIGLSNGVALMLLSPELRIIRQQIADQFSGHLTRDDRKPFEPHMTVQNRVTRRRARRTLGAIRASFTPFIAKAEGIALWFYDGGPWEPLEDIPFGA